MGRRDCSNSIFIESEVTYSFFQTKEAEANKSWWQLQDQGLGHLPSSLAFFLLDQTSYSILYFCSALLLKIQGICVCLGFLFVLNIIYSLQISVC